MQTSLPGAWAHHKEHPDCSIGGSRLALGNSIGGDIPTAKPRIHRRHLRRLQVGTRLKFQLRRACLLIVYVAKTHPSCHLALKSSQPRLRFRPLDCLVNTFRRKAPSSSVNCCIKIADFIISCVKRKTFVILLEVWVYNIRRMVAIGNTKPCRDNV